jgi:Rieske Fe-S protein
MTNIPATPSPDPATDPTPDPDGLSRRTMLRGAAVGGLALPLLAACGGGSSDTRSGDSGSGDSASSDPSSGGSSSSGSGSGGSSRGSGGSVTVAEADVPVGGGTILTSDKVVVTQPTKGQFKAFSAICTHQGCTVGSVTGGQIVCPCHGSHFSIKDGSPLAGPASAPLPAKKATLKGGEVSVS